MDKKTEYTAQDFTASLSAPDYIARYRDPERFIEYCRRCPNFGASWACPPFEADAADFLYGYRHVLLIATKITPLRSGLPLGETQRLIRPERLRLEKRLLEMERLYGGRSLAYAGSCLHCPEGSCARRQGAPCRHPERVRPSLEAWGFDVGATAAELLGIPLEWGRDGLLPKYLTLVCGFFHDSESVEWSPDEA